MFNINSFRHGNQIKIPSGIHHISQPITLTGENIRITGEKNTVLRGTLPLSRAAFCEQEEDIWCADVPCAVDAFYIGARKYAMARYPKASHPDEIFGGYAADCISPSKTREWADPFGGYIHAMHSALWGGYSYKITGKNEDGSLRLDGGHQNNRQMGMHKEYRFAENIREELSQEGEWYFDKSEKKLYYIPYSDEVIDECEIYASGAVDTIIRIENGKYYRNFENLTFAHTGWKNAAANGEVRWQGNQQILPSASSLGSAPHNIPIPGALQASFSNNIKVKDCVFKHTGGAGLVLSGPTKNNVIDGNVFYDIADSSMYLGYNNKSYKYKASNINVTNNVITGTGKKYYTASAVTVYGAEKTYISHNDISDCPYTGIHVGPLMWDNEFTSESSAEHNAGEYSGDIHIENNRIHEIAKTNVDGAAIYTLGHNHDSTIRGNYIKNQYMDYSAIYNDDGSACFEIKDNVSENVPGWLYHWNDDIFFVNASNNYSTTNENYGGLKSLQSSIEDVNIFSSDNKPEVVNQIIANAGLENEYAQKIGKYIPNEPEVVVPEFENVYINTQTNVETMLNAGFEANDSNRYCWKAIGSNSSKVSFKDSLTTYWNKGMQFDKIYAMFSTAGTYEILCQADDGRGNIYANKITVTVK